MKIIIATDGSDFSDEAVRKACELIVNPQHAEIKIVSVYQPYIPIDSFPQSAAYYDEYRVAMHTAGDVIAQKAVTTIYDRFPRTDIIITTLVTTGATDQVIVETAKDWNADLIVVGSHGRGFWGRVMIGSVSDSVVHNAHCSVLVVRKTITETDK
jgi:nucleotide-binding universal stress UspA family protein